MKRFSFILAMLALVLVVGLAFMSCGDDEGSNSGGGGNRDPALNGTWQAANHSAKFA